MVFVYERSLITGRTTRIIRSLRMLCASVRVNVNVPALTTAQH